MNTFLNGSVNALLMFSKQSKKNISFFLTYTYYKLTQHGRPGSNGADSPCFFRGQRSLSGWVGSVSAVGYITKALYM